MLYFSSIWNEINLFICINFPLNGLIQQCFRCLNKLLWSTRTMNWACQLWSRITITIKFLVTFFYFRLLNEQLLTTMDRPFKSLTKVFKAYQLFTIAVIKQHVVSSVSINSIIKVYLLRVKYFDFNLQDFSKRILFNMLNNYKECYGRQLCICSSSYDVSF